MLCLLSTKSLKVVQASGKDTSKTSSKRDNSDTERRPLGRHSWRDHVSQLDRKQLSGYCRWEQESLGLSAHTVVPCDTVPDKPTQMNGWMNTYVSQRCYTNHTGDLRHFFFFFTHENENFKYTKYRITHWRWKENNSIPCRIFPRFPQAKCWDGDTYSDSMNYSIA